MAEPLAPQAGRNPLADAIGALIWKDPTRILEHVARLRGTGAVIECNLRGASMGTAIPAGSAIRIRLEESRSYRVGEIVAFVVHDGLCVHRIAHLGRRERVRNYLITQGDACFNPDPPIELRHVLGPVVEFRDRERWVPAAGRPSRDRAQSLTGRALLKIVASLMEADIRLARGATWLLRLRKEREASLKA